MKILIANNQGYITISARAELEQICGSPEMELKWVDTYSDWETLIKKGDDCEIFAVADDIPLNMLTKLVSYKGKKVIMKTEKGWEQITDVVVKTKPISIC